MKTWKMGVGVSMAIAALFAAPACSSSGGGKGSNTTSGTGGSNTTSGTGGSGTAGGASWSCTAKGPFPNDQAPSASQVQDCQANLSDPDCGSAFMAEAVCNFSNAICDDAGVSEASESCKPADLTWANCLVGDAGTD